MRKLAFIFAYAKTKEQISCKVTVNLKFQASNHLLWLYSLVCVGNDEDRFSHAIAQIRKNNHMKHYFPKMLAHKDGQIYTNFQDLTLKAL